MIDNRGQFQPSQQQQQVIVPGGFQLQGNYQSLRNLDPRGFTSPSRNSPSIQNGHFQVRNPTLQASQNQAIVLTRPGTGFSRGVVAGRPSPVSSSSAQYENILYKIKNSHTHTHTHTDIKIVYTSWNLEP